MAPGIPRADLALPACRIGESQMADEETPDVIDVDYWHLNYRRAYRDYRAIMPAPEADVAAAAYADYCATATAPVLNPNGWLDRNGTR